MVLVLPPQFLRHAQFDGVGSNEAYEQSFYDDTLENANNDFQAASIEQDVVDCDFTNSQISDSELTKAESADDEISDDEIIPTTDYFANNPGVSAKQSLSLTETSEKYQIPIDL